MGKQPTKRPAQPHSENRRVENHEPNHGLSSLTPKQLSEIIISIHQSKLPNPDTLGNCGSFFKNPIISKTNYEELKIQYPDIPSYLIDETQVKVPAGWLIDRAGLKGYRKGDAGVHNLQALVLVNYGKATGKEILAVAHYVQATVLKQFGITLEFEVLFDFCKKS